MVGRECVLVARNERFVQVAPASGGQNQSPTAKADASRRAQGSYTSVRIAALTGLRAHKKSSERTRHGRQSRWRQQNLDRCWLREEILSRHCHRLALCECVCVCSRSACRLLPRAFALCFLPAFSLVLNLNLTTSKYKVAHTCTHSDLALARTHLGVLSREGPSACA